MAKKRKAFGPVVGLDIGSRWIKAVEVRPSRGGAAITGIGYEPTPQGAVVEDAILDANAIAAAIKRLFSNSGITVRKVVSAVSGQSSVVVRIIEVPRMTEKELAETMKWEVERHVPFPVNQTVMDFKMLNRPSAPPDAQSMEVLLAVCQEDVVKKHIEALGAAKLSPDAIEVESVALPRALIAGDPEAESLSTVAVAEIGNEATELCIYENKVLVFPRSIPIAGSNLTRALIDTMGMSEDEAEAALREHGSVDISLLSDLSEPAVGADASGFGVAETQLGGYTSPFAAPEPPPAPDTPFAAAPPAADAGPPEPPPVPPPMGFDLGEEFIPASPQPAGEPEPGETAEPEQPRAVFDLGDEDFKSAAPVFDLDDDVQPDAQPGAQPETQMEPPPLQVEAVPDPEQPESGVQSNSQSQISSMIAPVLAELAAELKRSLDYYTSRNPAPVDALILSGGVAKLPGLAGYLEQSLGLPVSVGDPVSRLPMQSKRYGPEYLADVSPVFSVSLGLALRGYAGGEG